MLGPNLLDLFILAMDPLQNILDKATEIGLLTPIGANPVKMRMSLYADDVILFMRPIATDVTNLHPLLNLFGKARGLCTNILKSEIYPIRCEGINIHEIFGDFQAQRVEFPCSYLGLSLRVGRVRRADELLERGVLPKY
jgi:hypothetical protein